MDGEIDPGFWFRRRDRDPQELTKTANGRRFTQDRYGKNAAVLLCVATIVWNDRGQILQVSRRDDPTAFTLPGGKVDDEDFVNGVYLRTKAEALERAARRELLEETGILATKLEQVFEDYDWGDHYTTTFWAKATEGSVKTREPHVIRWAAPSTLLDGPFADYYRRMFAEVGVRL